MARREEPMRPYGTARSSGPRLAIARAVDVMPGAFTAEELGAATHDASSGPVSTATVYRAIAAMEESGFIERVGERGGRALYARCEAGGHHHHVVCDGCGRVAHAECPVVPELARAGAPSGFTITRHEITLYGLCPECATESVEKSC